MITSFDIKVEKMRKYCLYTDRCHKDVRTKLIKDKVYGDELEQIIGVLIEEGFLDEERFARAFVKGKFKQNKWGKKRILIELKKRSISPYCIRKGFEEISDEDYLKNVQRLWDKKFEQVKESDPYKKKQKVLNYLIGKGYEYEVVKEVMP